MDSQALEQALRNLPRNGTLIKDYPYRQIWRMEVQGRGYYLKFFPRRENRWRRIFRGSPAMREFLRLRWLQKAGIPSAHAVSALMGLTINGKKGDGVLIEAIEPSVSLRELAQQAHLSGAALPNHRNLVAQVIDILKQMGEAKLGHADLHLGNFLLKDGKVYLIDAYPLNRRGLRTADVMGLANSARDVATRTDLWRIWLSLAGGPPMPARSRRADAVFRKQMSRVFGENRYFSPIAEGGWSGMCTKRFSLPRCWSRISQMEFTAEQWQQAWPWILALLETGQFDVLKTSQGGDVLAGEIIVGGRPLDVVIKRPRRRRWRRYLTQVLQGSRARRAWERSWRLIHRDIPCAWPVLMMERRKLGYVADAIVVFERLRGASLASMDLCSLTAADRQTLFHRAGAVLRKLEATGMYHWDAKSSNWMVIDGPRGPQPMLVDMDGVAPNLGNRRGCLPPP